MRALLDVVAPTLCVACGDPSDGELCGSCARRIAVISPPICARCGAPERRPLCDCDRIGGFARARSLVAFAEPARSLTLAFKRRARTSTIDAVGGLLADLAVAHGLCEDVGHVTFVPAGRKSRRLGFDHSELLARATARRLGMKAPPLLARAGEGPRQADVPLERRRHNVSGRFAARAVTGPVLLVDDVYTTGATAEACATALREAGASAVNVVTWARTLRKRR